MTFALELRETENEPWTPALLEGDAGDLVPAVYDTRADAETDGRFYAEGSMMWRVTEVQP
jgi:hypothetical protein